MTSVQLLGALVFALCLIAIGIGYIVGVNDLHVRLQRVAIVACLIAIVGNVGDFVLAVLARGTSLGQFATAVRSFFAEPAAIAITGALLLCHGAALYWWLTRRRREEQRRFDAAARDAAWRRSRGRLPPTIDGGEA